MFKREIKNQNKNCNLSEILLKKHDSGELNDGIFLQKFKNETLYYSAPFGDHKDGSKKLFLVPISPVKGYLPVFVSKENMEGFFDAQGRTAYLILESQFVSLIRTTKEINDKKPPVTMGLIIEPGRYDVTVEAENFESIINFLNAN